MDTASSAQPSPLHRHASLGDVAQLKNLVKSGNVDSVDEEGNSPLLCAARKGQQTACQLLVETFHASIAHTNNLGWTALHVASFAGHVEVIKYLLKKRGNPAAVDKLGQNAAMLAASAGHCEALQAIVRHTPGLINASADLRGATLLHVAARAGHDDVVKFLLSEKHISINATDKTGSTALHRAAHNGRDKSVKLLLDAGADRTIADKAGKAAAELARTDKARALLLGVPIQSLPPACEIPLARQVCPPGEKVEPRVGPRTTPKIRQLSSGNVKSDTASRGASAASSVNSSRAASARSSVSAPTSTSSSSSSRRESTSPAKRLETQHDGKKEVVPDVPQPTPQVQVVVESPVMPAAPATQSTTAKLAPRASHVAPAPQAIPRPAPARASSTATGVSRPAVTASKASRVLAEKGKSATTSATSASAASAAAAPPPSPPPHSMEEDVAESDLHLVQSGAHEEADLLEHDAEVCEEGLRGISGTASAFSPTSDAASSPAPPPPLASGLEQEGSDADAEEMEPQTVEMHVYDHNEVTESTGQAIGEEYEATHYDDDENVSAGESVAFSSHNIEQDEQSQPEEEAEEGGAEEEEAASAPLVAGDLLTASEDLDEARSTPSERDETLSHASEDARVHTPEPPASSSTLAAPTMRSAGGSSAPTSPAKRNSANLDKLDPATNKMTLRELQRQRRINAALDNARLEEYLTEEEFFSVFKMRRAAFMQMPEWKRTQKKQLVKLF